MTERSWTDDDDPMWLSQIVKQDTLQIFYLLFFLITHENPAVAWYMGGICELIKPYRAGGVTLQA